jgi:hypothetical protein
MTAQHPADRFVDPAQACDQRKRIIDSIFGIF